MFWTDPGFSLSSILFDIYILSDEIRCADDDNPRGYFELEKVKGLAKDASWIMDVQGKAIKVISILLYNLPMVFFYNVIFMRRNMNETLVSQHRMLERNHKTSALSDEKMGMFFE